MTQPGTREPGTSEPGPREPGRRHVMHVDMDAFYAAVEVKEQPELRGRAVVVGGTGGRGVVCSASYEARAYGVRSATPMALARRLCPQAVVLSPRFDLYQRYSRQLHEVFNEVTPLVEGIALDEAFLDVTGSTALLGQPAQIAAHTRQAVQQRLGLTCSVGMGPNKLIAKLASKAAKPHVDRDRPRPGPGIVVVEEDEVLDFLWPMQVEALWGVGQASAARLRKLGVSTVGSLAALPRPAVVSALGKAAGELVWELAWGRDDRPVVADRAPKSIGHEETYPSDLVDREELRRRLVIMADSVAARVRGHGYVARTVTLKLRYDDFRTITRSHTFSAPQRTGPALWGAAMVMFEGVDLRQGVRLLGVTASGLLPSEAAPGEQLQLELAARAGAETTGPSTPESLPADQAVMPEGGHPLVQEEAWDRASRAMDAVRARFGDEAVGPATALGRVRRANWPSGPSGHG